MKFARVTREGPTHITTPSGYTACGSGRAWFPAHPGTTEPTCRSCYKTDLGRRAFPDRTYVRLT